MRTRPQNKIISALFPETRAEILAATLGEPTHSWYLSDLAQHLDRPPSSLQRELESLVEGEILLRRQDGNRVYFQANTTCPVHAELAGLFAKTVGAQQIIRDALRKLDKRIQIAFLYGSLARSEEHAASDVDLAIIGDVGLAEVALLLRPWEEVLSRSINASIYTADEFAQRMRARNHFLSSVLAREKTFLLGTEHDLEKLAGRPPSAAPRDEQARTG